MAYRWHPKNSETDPDSPRAWATADCCGFIWPLHKLQWQYSYAGTVNPQNTRFLVCPKHLDPLNPQDMAYILPPDPLPIFNARPEPYVMDETDWLSTGVRPDNPNDILETQDGELLVTQPSATEAESESTG